MSDLPKDVDEYIAKYQSAVQMNEECGTSHYNLAVGYLGKRMFNEAEKELLAAIDCSPSLAEAYVQMGGICLHRGDLDGCLDWNKRATQARAGFAEAYGNLGFVYLQKGELEESLKFLEKAIAFNSQFIQAYVTLGSAYLMSGAVDESIAASEKALSIDPDFPVAHNNLSLAHIEKGDWEKAISHADKAEALGYTIAPEVKKALDAHR